MAAGIPPGSIGDALKNVATLPERGLESVMYELQQDLAFWRAKQAVKQELIKPFYGVSQVPTAINEVLRIGGLSGDMKSFSYERLRHWRRNQLKLARISNPDSPSQPLPPLPTLQAAVSTLDVVDWARQRWAYHTLAHLRKLSREQQQPFLRARQRSDGQCDDEDEEVNTHHIVEIQNLHDLLTKELRARSSTVESASTRNLRWSTLGIQLHCDTLDTLVERYSDLAPHREHCGVPDTYSLGVTDVDIDLCERRETEAQGLLARPYAPELQKFLRLGAPVGMRRELWSKALVVDMAMAGSCSIQDFARGICAWEWLTDDALRLDVQEHCANDVCFFPFEEIIEAMILALSRDNAVGPSCECGLPQIPIVAGPDAEAVQRGAGSFYVPPSGIVPFRGYSCYAYPFAFLSDRLEVAYPLFRTFYCRYLSRLHTISCEPGTLLHLCTLFESLVFNKVPHVSLHLAQLGAEAAPLRTAFPWIVRGFVGFLRVDEVLQLWDRVIGFDSCEPIAMLAAAIFIFRSRLLLNARTVDDVQLAFSDISSLQSIPLLQLLLAEAELGPNDF